MLRTVKRLMALSLGTAREQFVQRTNRTWPRPGLLRLYWLACHYLCAAAHIPSIPSLLRHLDSGDGGTEEVRWYRCLYLTALTHVKHITWITVLTTPFVHCGDTTRGGSWLLRDARLHSRRARHSCQTSCRVDHGLCASAQVACAQ